MRDALSAVLFSEILKPVAASLGPLGEIAAGTAAQSVFVRPPR